MSIIDKIEKAQCKASVPDFNIGDTVKVSTKIIEGTTERIQNFTGVVIARKNSGLRETFTVRRFQNGYGVERVFPIHSPRIDAITVERHGHVRRAKLYYLRDKIGKAARVKGMRLFWRKRRVARKFQRVASDAGQTPPREARTVIGNRRSVRRRNFFRRYQDLRERNVVKPRLARGAEREVDDGIAGLLGRIQPRTLLFLLIRSAPDAAGVLSARQPLFVRICPFDDKPSADGLLMSFRLAHILGLHET